MSRIFRVDAGFRAAQRCDEAPLQAARAAVRLLQELRFALQMHDTACMTKFQELLSSAQVPAHISLQGTVLPFSVVHHTWG